MNRNIPFRVFALLGNRFSISNNMATIAGDFGVGDGPILIECNILTTESRIYRPARGIISGNKLYASIFKNGIVFQGNRSQITNNTIIGTCTDRWYPDIAQDTPLFQSNIITQNSNDGTSYICQTNLTNPLSDLWNSSPTEGYYYIKWWNGLEMRFPVGDGYDIGDTIPNADITWRRWK